MNDQERTWLDNVMSYGGGFVVAFAEACFRADDQNFEILRPALAALMAKYPKYENKMKAILA